MSIAKIIAPMTGAKRDSVALATAFAAARLFDAHVVALFARPDPRLSVPYIGEPLAPIIVQSLIDDATALTERCAKRVRLTLEKEAEKASAAVLAKAGHRAEPTCSYREQQGFFAETIVKAAELADLVVFGPVTPLDGSDLSEALFDTLTKAERPILLAENPPARLGCKITLAWDGDRAAAHAVVAALPFLKRAETINILTIYDEKQPDLADLREYLALHDLRCDLHAVRRAGRPIADLLLEHAQQLDSDLLVMGGYGHSYIREMLFGGVTATMRWHPSIPVLMVH